MKINFEYTIRRNLPKHLVQPRRSMVYIGFQCHLKCGFCYYKYRCHEKMFDFEIIKKLIDFEYLYGIRNFEITGGEPSEYKELRKVCEYIKQNDSSSKIAVITNGGLWKSNVWDLIDEVLVSYHTCRDETLIDNEIFPLGSTYNKVKKTIDLAHKLNKFVRTNTVCATFNLNLLDKIVDDLISFNPKIINFLPVNLFDLAKYGMTLYINYNKFRPIIKTLIDKVNSKLNCEINIRYMPFCDMENYELYIKGNLLHIFDEHDWNRELDGIYILEMIKLPEYWLEKLGRYGSTSIKKALELLKSFYEKKRECLTCKYNIICDGIEKTENNLLLNYIIPHQGKIILNPLEFNS